MYNSVDPWLALAGAAYVMGAGVAGTTRADYRVLLGVQTTGLAMLLLIIHHNKALNLSWKDPFLKCFAAVLALSLAARLGFAQANTSEVEKSAKFNRWDTMMASLSYLVTVSALFRAMVPRGVIPFGRGWLGATTVMVAVPSLTAAASAAFSPRADDDMLALTSRASLEAYTQYTHRNAATDTRVLVRPTEKGLIIAFGGTDSSQNVKTDVRVTDTNPDFLESVSKKLRVHTGFSRAYLSVRDTIFDATEQADHKLTVTGHSLGGALATLAALDLSLRGYTVSCYTYGAPQVGDQLFVEAFNSKVFQSVRVVNGLDPVPKSLSLQFMHVKGMYPVSTTVTINPHDMSEYAVAVNRPKALGIMAVIVPLVYIGVLLGAAYGSKKVIKRIKHSGWKNLD